jgi:hypothetical protein
MEAIFEKRRVKVTASAASEERGGYEVTGLRDRRSAKSARGVGFLGGAE